MLCILLSVNTCFAMWFTIQNFCQANRGWSMDWLIISYSEPGRADYLYCRSLPKPIFTHDEPWNRSPHKSPPASLLQHHSVPRPRKMLVLLKVKAASAATPVESYAKLDRQTGYLIRILPRTYPKRCSPVFHWRHAELIKTQNTESARRYSIIIRRIKHT
jgi:hypothetical protein